MTASTSNNTQLTGETQTYVIQYPITTYATLRVERDKGISEEDLLDSVTKVELSGSDVERSCIWDSLKDGWRNAEPADCYITDEDGEELFSD